MASSPLFVVDVTTLRGKLRLTGLPTGQDAEKIFDEAVLAGRVRFVRRLGTARIITLQAITFSENPTTDDQYLRALANTTEVQVVRLELMCRLPWLWQDSQGHALKSWNEEAPFRELTPKQIEEKRALLEREIEQAMDLLEGLETFGAEICIRAFDGKPLEEAPRIGDSLGRFFPNDPFHDFEHPDDP